jgi:hypothetical protein
MKNVEKHINEIVSKVLSEQVALKAEEIMSMANEELHGGQKKLDKNKNGKLDSDDFKMLRKDKKEKPRTPAGFEHGEIVSGDVDEDEVDSQWMADEKLAKNEPLYRGTKFVDESEIEEYSFGDTATDDDLGYNDMLPSAKYEKEIKTPHKVKNVGDKYQRKVSKEFSENEDEGFPDLSGDGKITKKDVLLGRGVKLKESFQLTEDELVELIENIVKEQTEVKETNSSLKKSKTENNDYIKSVTKKMKEYLKDASKGEYDMNPEQFPKGNGELAKMAKKAYTPSGAVEEYIENFAYSPGMENLQYDEIKPNEEWMEKTIEGSSMTGNGKGGNAIDTGLGKKINTKRKNNLYGAEKNRSYNRVPQPVDNAGEEKGADKLNNMFKKLGESDEKKTKLINEEMEKMKHLLGYKKKTQ